MTISKDQLIETLNALAAAAQAINDSQEEEGERARGDDVLCLTIAEDGRGSFGRVWHDHSLDSDVIEPWYTEPEIEALAEMIWPYLEGVGT